MTSRHWSRSPSTMSAITPTRGHARAKILKIFLPRRSDVEDRDLGLLFPRRSAASDLQGHDAAVHRAEHGALDHAEGRPGAHDSVTGWPYAAAIEHGERVALRP